MKRAAALLALSLLLGGAAKPLPQRHDWPSYGGQVDEAGYADLAAIDRSNVDRLGLAWSLDLPGEQSLGVASKAWWLGLIALGVLAGFDALRRDAAGDLAVERFTPRSFALGEEATVRLAVRNGRGNEHFA